MVAITSKHLEAIKRVMEQLSPCCRAKIELKEGFIYKGKKKVWEGWGVCSKCFTKLDKKYMKKEIKTKEIIKRLARKFGVEEKQIKIALKDLCPTRTKKK